MKKVMTIVAILAAFGVGSAIAGNPGVGFPSGTKLVAGHNTIRAECNRGYDDSPEFFTADGERLVEARDPVADGRAWRSAYLGPHGEVRVRFWDYWNGHRRAFRHVSDGTDHAAYYRDDCSHLAP